MTKVIWKYPVLVHAQSFSLEMPRGAQILSVHTQHEQPQMWVLSDQANALDAEVRDFAVYGTGHDVPDDPGRYVGTFQIYEGSLVFHLFERTKL